MGRRRRSASEERPAKTESVVVPASRCTKCGSTDRAPYRHVRELAYGGTTPAGEEYTHTVWRRTRCLACGQLRDDVTRENRTAPA